MVNLSEGSKLRQARQARRLNAEFNEIEKVLNKRYEICNTMATMSSVTIECANAGGSATLKGSGVGKQAVPETLEVCSIGAYMKETCETLYFETLNRDDYSDAVESFLAGGSDRRLKSEFNDIEKLLNKRYENCNTMATMSSVTIECTNAGGSATLKGQGAGKNAVPVSLKVCSIGAYTKETCETLDFETLDGQDYSDAADSFLAGGSDRRLNSAFDAIEKLLKKQYENCNTMATMSSVTIECTNVGGSATLKGQGVGEEAVPVSLEVCSIGAYMVKTCHAVDFEKLDQLDVSAFVQSLLDGLFR